MVYISDAEHIQGSRDDEQLERVIEAMADPLRCRLLSTLAEVPRKEHSGGGLTVRCLSERLGEPRRKVRYHLDALRAQGLVEISDSRSRAGVVERFFAPVRLPILYESDVAALPARTQQKIFLSCLKMIFADATAALASGTAVSDPDWAAARMPGNVDGQGRRELADLHVEFIREARDILARASRRIAHTEEQPVEVVSASLFFVAAPFEPPKQ